MNITLTKSCSMQDSDMIKTAQGHFCPSCQKQVVDYRHMTDREMLAYIKKHGLGCGTWRPEQLNRPLITPRKKAFPFAWAASLLLLAMPVKSQENKSLYSVQIDTVKTTGNQVLPAISDTTVKKAEECPSTFRGTGSFVKTSPNLIKRAWWGIRWLFKRRR